MATYPPTRNTRTLAGLEPGELRRLRSAWDDTDTTQGDVVRRFRLGDVLLGEVMRTWGPKPKVGSVSPRALSAGKRMARVAR